MDINRLFRAGMNACGRVMSVLPEKDIGTPKQFMMEVLEDETLPSLNKLYPRLFKTILHTDKLIPVENDSVSKYVGYRIPLELTEGLKITGIKSLYTGVGGFDTGNYRENNGYLGSTVWRAGMPNKFGRYSSANLYESVFGALVNYTDLQLMGTIQEAPIPRFEPPNIMWINRTYGSAKTMYVTLLLENDKNLLTIDDTVYEGVKRLFILDLKKTIYNRFGMLSNIDTSIGTIDLKIDDWSGASQERDELYDQYESLSHLRRTAMISG